MNSYSDFFFVSVKVEYSAINSTMSLQAQACAILKSLEDCLDQKAKEELIYNILIEHQSKVDDLRDRIRVLHASKAVTEKRLQDTQEVQAATEKRLQEAQEVQVVTKKRLRETELSRQVLASLMVRTKHARF